MSFVVSGVLDSITLQAAVDLTWFSTTALPPTTKCSQQRVVRQEAISQGTDFCLVGQVQSVVGCLCELWPSVGMANYYAIMISLTQKGGEWGELICDLALECAQQYQSVQAVKHAEQARSG